MASPGILHHVALVRDDVSEELSASFIRVTRISELGTTLAVTIDRRSVHRNVYYNLKFKSFKTNFVHYSRSEVFNLGYAYPQD
jgi:hypothetical protein